MAERRVTTYKPEQVSVIVGSHIVTGFARGSFIDVSYNNDAASYQAGLVNGAVIVNPNREGQIRLTLLQTSTSNSHLQTYISRLRNGASEVFYFNLYVINNSGGELASADAAFITTEPNLSFSDGLTNRAWTIKTGNLTLSLNSSYPEISGT